MNDDDAAKKNGDSSEASLRNVGERVVRRPWGHCNLLCSPQVARHRRPCVDACVDAAATPLSFTRQRDIRVSVRPLCETALSSNEKKISCCKVYLPGGRLVI